MRRSHKEVHRIRMLRSVARIGVFFKCEYRRVFLHHKNVGSLTENQHDDVVNSVCVDGDSETAGVVDYGKQDPSKKSKGK